MNEFFKLILLTHRQNRPLNPYLDFIKQCAEAGITCVQLREKNTEPALHQEFACRLKELLLPYDIALMINDDPLLAQAVDADGVHLGQKDMPPTAARHILGSHKFIGWSVESLIQVQQANTYPLNYIAASAVFPSNNKKNVNILWGIHGVRHLCQLSTHPVIGIGGINQHNLLQLLKAGVQGVAIIDAIHQAKNPATMTQTLRTLIDKRSTLYDPCN